MSHFITYLALDRPARISSDALVQRYRTLYSEEAYRIRSGNEADAVDQALIVVLDDMPVTVMFVDAPLPKNAYVEALALERVWPEAGDAMATCQAHVIVALVSDSVGHLPSLNGAAAVTLVAGALASLLPVQAVISVEGSTIVKPEAFAPMASGLSKHKVPVAFWTSLIFLDETPGQTTPQKITALSKGLLPFVGREVEFEPAGQPIYEVAERLVRVIEYLVLNGPVIKDGDSIELSPNERTVARHRISTRRPGTPIIEFELVSSKSSLREEPQQKSTSKSFGRRSL